MKNQNKPIRERQRQKEQNRQEGPNHQSDKLLHINELTGQLSNTKKPERPQKTFVVYDHTIIYVVKKEQHNTRSLSRCTSLTLT